MIELEIFAWRREDYSIHKSNSNKFKLVHYNIYNLNFYMSIKIYMPELQNHLKYTYDIKNKSKILGLRHGSATSWGYFSPIYWNIG